MKPIPHALLYFLDHFPDIRRRSTAGIDDKTTVFLGHLRTADTVAPQARIHDKFARIIPLWPLECAASAPILQWLRCFISSSIFALISSRLPGVSFKTTPSTMKGLFLMLLVR